MPWSNQLIRDLQNQNQPEQYIVASIEKNTGEMSISNHPKIHNDQYAAGVEASRLAGISKTKKFAVLHVVAVYEVENIIVTNRL